MLAAPSGGIARSRGPARSRRAACPPSRTPRRARSSERPRCTGASEWCPRSTATRAACPGRDRSRSPRASRLPTSPTTSPPCGPQREAERVTEALGVDLRADVRRDRRPPGRTGGPPGRVRPGRHAGSCRSSSRRAQRPGSRPRARVTGADPERPVGAPTARCRSCATSAEGMQSLVLDGAGHGGVPTLPEDHGLRRRGVLDGVVRVHHARDRRAVLAPYGSAGFASCA